MKKMGEILFYFFSSSYGQMKGHQEVEKIALKESKKCTKGKPCMFVKFASYTHTHLMPPCTANYNAIYLRNFPKWYILTCTRLYFSHAISAKIYSQPMRVRTTDNTQLISKCCQCTTPQMFPTTEPSIVLSCVEWVLHCLLSTTLGILLLQFILC